MKIKQAVCLIIYVTDESMIGLTRKKDPSKIGLPGGKVDENETLEEALIREVKEELNFDISNLLRSNKIVPVYSSFDKGGKTILDEDSFWVTTYKLLEILPFNELKKLDPETGSEIKFLYEYDLTDDNLCEFSHYNRRLFDELGI